SAAATPRSGYPGPMLAALAVWHVLTSIALVTLVLMHSGRDAGLGGMGFTPASQGGTHIVEKNLTRLTIVVATIFVANAVCLVQYTDGHGYPPTVREIGEHVGLASPSTVHAHLANLERAGLLKRDPTKPRALELTGRRTGAPAAVAESRKLPLLGHIAAGGPMLAEETIEDYICV